MRSRATLASQLVLAMLLAASAAAEPPGSPAAKESLQLCDRVDELPTADQLIVLARGLAIAERAVAADHNDAKAHFALVCNLGKQIQVSRIGFSSWFHFQRLRRELNATLALAPDDADALAAQGALLLHLPRLLGGDATEAERLLRRALEIEPDNSAGRRYLAEALESRGATDQARALLAVR